jgi:ABC-type dipeptide/oligopeptide/nickel transport system permease subunit
VKLVLNLVMTFALMVLVLLAVGLLGGVGTVELSIWFVVLIVVAMAVVARRSRRQVSS